MSWIGPVAKNAAKYGPQVKMAWDTGGRPAKDAAVRAGTNQLNRRKAFQRAGTVVDGSVIKAIDAGLTYWVVLGAGDVPIESYPPSPIPISELLHEIDLSKKKSFADWDAARLKNKRPKRREGRRAAPSRSIDAASPTEHPDD